MPKSTDLANAINDFYFGGAALTPPATFYVALFSVAPTVSGGGTEFSGGGYARVAVTNNNTNFPASVSGSKGIGAAVTFPTLTADHPDAVAFGLFDAVSGGNFLGWGLITPNKQCLAADVPFFPANTGLIFTES